MNVSTMLCPIWHTEATGRIMFDSDKWLINSPRAGGSFVVSDRLKTLTLPNMQPREKARLTTSLIRHRGQGDECPEITLGMVERAKASSSLLVYEQANRLLRHIADRADALGGSVVLLSGGLPELRMRLLAELEFADEDELYWLLTQLRDRGWLWFVTRMADTNASLTLDGYNQITDVATRPDPFKVFVAMWFHDNMAEAYTDGFQAAIEDAGFKPVRIDRKEHINKIEDEIIAEIRQSRFLVADFTHGPDGARGGVYFEAGFAHGLNLPVFYTCRKDCKDTLHFDTAHYNHILWDTPGELRKALRDRIRAVIPASGMGAFFSE